MDTWYRTVLAVAVGWNTFKKLQQPKVHYGLWPNALWLTAEAGPASSTTYQTSRTWSNVVVLENLTPNTKYCKC